MEKGKFFTFSGMEGTGKSTIVNRLGVEDNNSTVIIEPHFYFRDFLLSNDYEPDPYTEMLVFMAARSYNYHKIVKPDILNGINVYADRWIAETYTYQSYVKGVLQNDIDYLYRNFYNGTRETRLDNFISPTIEFILIAEPEISLERSNNAGNENRFEKYGIEFHKNIKEGFLAYKKMINSLCVIIDTSDKTIDEVYDIIKYKIDESN